MWDRVKNEGSRDSMTGGYWVRWTVGTITAREIDLPVWDRFKNEESELL